MKLEIDIETKPKNDKLNRKCKSSEDVFNLKEVQAIKNAIQEHFIFIGLDTANNIRNIRLLGVGKSNIINMDSKEIVRTALLTASEKVILVHNHPSNSLIPSDSDKYLSNYTNKVLQFFNIQMLDHIIVTEKEYLSMGKNNEIDFEFTNNKLEFIESTFLKEENKKLKEDIKELTSKIQKNKIKNDR